MRSGPLFRASIFHHANGEYAKAIKDDEEALRIDETCFRSHNGLAWIRATCTEESIRNGKLAVVHALRAMELVEGESLAPMGTLAAAYAEAGNFEEAVRWARKYLESDLPEENLGPARLRLSLFEQGKPFRETRGNFGDDFV